MHIDTTPTTPAPSDNEKIIDEICERVAAECTRAGLECTPADVRNANIIMQLAALFVDQNPDAGKNKQVRRLANTSDKNGMSAAITAARLERQLRDAPEDERLSLVILAVIQILILLDPGKFSKRKGWGG